MNYFQKIAGSIQKSSWDSVFLKNYDIDKLFGEKVEKEPYKLSELVYMCISTTARAISQVPLVIMQPAKQSKKGKALSGNDFIKLKMASVSMDSSREKIIGEAIKSGELEFADPNNPWQKLFDKPNQYTDGTLLKYGLVGYILLDGNSWLLPFPVDAKLPLQLWVIPKQHLELKKNESTGHLSFWSYKPQGIQLRPIPVKPEELVHYRLWNPYDQIMGMAPIDAGKIAMRSDYKAATYNEKFFDNSAVPDGIVYTDKPLRTEQKTKTQAMLDDKHQGYQKAHRLMLLDKALKYERIGLTMKEMNFEGLRRYNRDTIFQIFGMKKAILSVTNDLNYATDKGQTKKWWTDTNLPLMRMIASGINSSPNLLAKTPYIIWWDKSAIESLQEDYKDKVETGEKLWKMGVSFTDVNDMLELGFDTKPEHDIGYIPSNLIPANPALRIPLAEEPKKVIPVIEIKQLPGIPEWEVKADNVWKSFAGKTERLERTFESKTSLTFYNMRKEVLKMIYDDKKTVKVISKEQLLQDIDDYNFQKEKELIDKASATLYEQAIKEGMATVAEELGMAIAWDVIDPAVLQYIAIRRSKVTGVVNTVKRQITRAISDGMKEGESIDDIVRRIKDVFNMANKRAITIARTEVVGTTNFGRHVQMNQTGFKQRRWFTAVDDRVRPQHMAMHGKVREVDKKWIMPDGAQLRYPGDYAGGASQTIACRCIEVVVKESYDSEMRYPGSQRAEEFTNENLLRGE